MGFCPEPSFCASYGCQGEREAYEQHMHDQYMRQQEEEMYEREMEKLFIIEHEWDFYIWSRSGPPGSHAGFNPHAR